VDLVVKDGTIVTASDIYRADIGIEGGKIALIGEGLEGEETIEASGMYVFPGFIDVHVHISLAVGGVVSTDDFTTGTIAAACGGTTTIISFINVQAGQSLREATRARRAEADGKVAIDYSLHLTGISAEPDHLAEIEELAAEGYTSLKLYTTYPDLMVDDGQMLKLLETAWRCGLLPIVHTENHHLIEHLKAKLIAEGKVEPRYHPLSRPPIAEAEAANRVLTLASVVGCPVYIVHVTCRETLEAIERARARGQEVFAEVTVNHLLLSQEEYELPGFEGAKFVLAPPLRDKSNWEPLWRALADNSIQVVSTDHCPWTFTEQKQRGQRDFTKIPNGAPGVETRIPLMFSEGVGKGRISLNRFVDACSTTPAKLFGLYPKKGTIAVGSDADLVIFDPYKEVTLSYKTLHQNVDYCPFEGWKVRGYPTTVLLRGRIIVREGEFVGEAGEGEFLPRRAAFH